MSMKNIDLSQEQIGTMFYTMNYSDAKLIQRIGSNLYRFEVDIFNSFDDKQIRLYNKRGNIIKTDMRKSHPLDLKEKQ